VEYTYVAGRARVKHSSRDDPGREHYGVKRSDFILQVTTRHESLADSSLAKTAILSVLSKKASRMKGVVDLLHQDSMGPRNREREERFKGIIARGCAAVRGAKY
jgi:hypothetical protein